MSGGACKRVSFNPDPEANDKLIFSTHTDLSSSSRHNHRRLVVGILSFGVSSSPAAMRLLRRIGTRVGKTLGFVSFGRKNINSTKTTSSSSSTNVSSSSSSSSIYLMKSKSLNETESHRAEAIEDCIQFLNSCSSLSRSNSISTWSC